LARIGPGRRARGRAALFHVEPASEARAGRAGDMGRRTNGHISVRKCLDGPVPRTSDRQFLARKCLDAAGPDGRGAADGWFGAAADECPACRTHGGAAVAAAGPRDRDWGSVPGVWGLVRPADGSKTGMAETGDNEPFRL
jgi:hypothetical protein